MPRNEITGQKDLHIDLLIYVTKLPSKNVITIHPSTVSVTASSTGFLHFAHLSSFSREMLVRMY